MSDPWIDEVEKAIEQFCARYSTVYSRTEREASASFEIGCFLSLIQYYELRGYAGVPENLSRGNEYCYSTTPSGSPLNYSYLNMECGSDKFSLRQQVRIRSHLSSDITFTPDFVVLCKDAQLENVKVQDFYGGTRDFCYVKATHVIAAHECKSMDPFPELMVSFLGMVVAGHSWIEQENRSAWVDEDGIHIAPSLFIGGTGSGLHYRMAQGLGKAYPMNVLLGVHNGMPKLDILGVSKIKNPFEIPERPLNRWELLILGDFPHQRDAQDGEHKGVADT